MVADVSGPELVAAVADAGGINLLASPVVCDSSFDNYSILLLSLCHASICLASFYIVFFPPFFFLFYEDRI